MYEPLPGDEQASPKATFSPKFRMQGAILAVALAVCGAGAYSLHERNVAKSATDQNAEMMASLKSTNAQIEQLTAKLNDLTAPKPAAEIPVAQSAPRHVTQVHRPSAARHRAAVRRDDPRWKEFQRQLDEQGKAISSTRDDLTNALTSTKTELGDSIARTHGELVVLQRKGERNYFEFNIDKSKQFSYHGSMGVRLRKANVKHQYADLELMVDDRSVTKKHVNIYEPAMFYSTDTEQPIQVVINSISKNHIRGYVSEPKYRRADLTAMQSNAQDGTQQTSFQPRQKLSLPR